MQAPPTPVAKANKGHPRHFHGLDDHQWDKQNGQRFVWTELLNTAPSGSHERHCAAETFFRERWHNALQFFISTITRINGPQPLCSEQLGRGEHEKPPGLDTGRFSSLLPAWPVLKLQQ
jgi:hypothetical protein